MGRRTTTRSQPSGRAAAAFTPPVPASRARASHRTQTGRAKKINLLYSLPASALNFRERELISYASPDARERAVRATGSAIRPKRESLAIGTRRRQRTSRAVATTFTGKRRRVR